MSALLITYDLNSPGQNYKDLHEAIKDLGPWWHYLDSTWIVSTSLTPNQVVDSIRTKFDSSDELLVIDITGDSYQGLLQKEAWDWIKKVV